MSDGAKEIKADNGSIAVVVSGSQNNLNVKIQNSAKLTSLLNPLLEHIVETCDFDEELDQIELPKMEAKISFNAVKVYAQDIRDSAGYMTLIEELIDQIDDENPNAKKRFQAAIHRNYKNHKNALLVNHSVNPSDLGAVQQLICEHADKLIQDVAQTILQRAEGELEAPVELVQAAQELIVGYGFINCKILEPPL